MQFGVLVAWEFESLESLVTVAHSHLTRHDIRSAMEPMVDPDGRLTELTVVAAASQMLLECAIQQTNNLVDSVLLALANGMAIDRSPEALVAGQRRSRQELQELIAERIGKPLDSLDGWNEVLRVRRDSNALKHRWGVTLTVHPELDSIRSESVQLTREDVLAAIAGVKAWLLTVVYEVERSGLTSASSSTPEALD